MMPARVRTLGVLIATASAALLLAACGSESVSVPESDTTAYEGAQIFATHCAGCHSISAAGTQGSGNRALRVQGPDFNQRKESYDDVLFAIHNGGFSGAIMPQNIVVGDEATSVARFLSKYAGADVVEQPRPTPTGNTEVGPANSQGDSVDSAASSQETTTTDSSSSQPSASK
jgi:mono/diheme cytochrome c family protein